MTPDEVFEQALALTLSFEGGLSDDVNDPGGRTMKGVTQRTYDDYLTSLGEPSKDVAFITDAELKDIYGSRYWNAIGGDDLPPGLALVAFDVAVNHGPRRALEWLQEGASTPVSITVRRMQHYVALTELWPRFGRGWARRAYAVLDAADKLEG